jgi:hypothetical protein
MAGAASVTRAGASAFPADPSDAGSGSGRPIIGVVRRLAFEEDIIQEGQGARRQGRSPRD